MTEPRFELGAAMARVAAACGPAEGAEEALWCINRTVPSLLGDRAAFLDPHALREPGPPTAWTAAAAFMCVPDGRHHMIVAPVNFPPEQHYELVDIALGHPGEVARTLRPLLLRDTALHAGFVKILQTFRAGSTLFAPMIWRGSYLGVLICASAARNTFGEQDLIAHQAFAGLAAACWVAQGGPAWLATRDLAGRPVRSHGT